MEQMIITAENNYQDLDRWIEVCGAVRIMLVCDDSVKYQTAFTEHMDQIRRNGREVIRFSDFRPNPAYESVVEGVRLFHEKRTDAIIAVGGGSALDVAKCIKLYSSLDSSRNYLKQEIIPNEIPFLAIPTTAGTGSEATRYAVIYFEGKKQSVTHDSCIPKTVLLDPVFLKTLPLYQRKATMMDAFCHALESFWSVNSTEESRSFSKEAIEGVLRYKDEYLSNTDEGNRGMLMVAHTAGKAINITQTTAGHAMCYKITSLFGCAHGHAAILCDRVLFEAMVKESYPTADIRGETFVRRIFDEIALALQCDSAVKATEKVKQLFNELELDIPKASEKQFQELRTSVNPVRLKNHPFVLNEEVIDKLYRRILKAE